MNNERTLSRYSVHRLYLKHNFHYANISSLFPCRSPPLCASLPAGQRRSPTAGLPGAGGGVGEVRGSVAVLHRLGQSGRPALLQHEGLPPHLLTAPRASRWRLPGHHLPVIVWVPLQNSVTICRIASPLTSPEGPDSSLIFIMMTCFLVCLYHDSKVSLNPSCPH